MTVIRLEEKSAIVEWIEDGRTRRSIVPANLLKDGEIDEKKLRRCPVYGEDWESAMLLFTTAEAVAEQLRRSGIWTKDDLMNHIREAQRAWNQIHAEDFGEFIKKTLS